MRSWSRRRLALVLAVTGALTATAVIVLALIPKSTPVELTVRLQRVAFTVPAPQPPHDHVRLFGDVPKALSLQCQGASRLRYSALSDKQPAVRELQPADRLTVRSDEPWRPLLRLKEEVRVEMEPARRDRLQVVVAPRGTGEVGWQLGLAAVSPLDLEIQGAGVEERVAVAPAPPPSVVGGRTPTRLGLRFEGRVGGSPPRAQVVPLDGEGRTVTVELPAAMSGGTEVHIAGNRLVLLRPASTNPRAGLLHANLAVRELAFYRLVGREAESALNGGRIRFLGGERAPVELSADFLLEAHSESTFTVKASALADGQLEMVLWGEPSSLRYGATPGLMDESLPSLLLWLYTHQTGTLAFSAVAWVVATLLAVLRFVGVAADGSS